MKLAGALRSVWVLMHLIKVFCTFSVMTHFNKDDILHQQASFHLSMSPTVMSEAESPHHHHHHHQQHHHLSSLINTHDWRSLTPLHPKQLRSLVFTLPCVDLSNRAHCTPLGLFSRVKCQRSARKPLFCTRALTFSPPPAAWFSEMKLSGDFSYAVHPNVCNW